MTEAMGGIAQAVPAADQGDAALAGSTVRRSRVSSIFQQKTIKPDDIDADFLKHVQFAAQRGSPMSASFTALAGDTQLAAPAAPAAEQSQEESSAQNASNSHVSSAAMQPMNIEEFTLDKIEQSIADIEAELGWTSGPPEQQPVAAPAAVSPAEGSKTTAVPASILTSSKTSVAGQSSSAGGQPQVKRLSFMGEINKSEPAVKSLPQAAASGTAAPAASVRTEPQKSSSLKRTPTTDSEAADNSHSRSISTADQRSVTHTLGASLDHEVPSRFAESARRLDHSLSEANLQSLSTRSRSFEGAQGDSAQSGAKRRVFRHSLSGKGTPSGGLAAQASYSSRYATRQVSGRSSPVHSDTASSGKRSLISSPATSIHGGQDPLMQSFGKSNKLSLAIPADGSSGATLAGAAAVLKSQVRPSASEGVGWHLATGDGLPFSPRGSLVASSGGSRTLRPITSQQEALFDAEGNLLPRHQAQPLQSDLEVLPEGTAVAAKTPLSAKGKSPSQQGDAAGGEDLTGAKQKSKHSMLSIIAFPCFCMRPTPTSADDPYTHGSLRERFAAKDAAQQKQPNSKVTKPALKQKGQSNSALLTEASRADWDLGTHVEVADAEAPGNSKWSTNEWQTAQAVDESLGEAKGPGLQGAVSLAPRRAAAADGSKAHVPSQEGSIAGELVSPTASFTSQRSTRSLAPALDAAVTPDTSVHDNPTSQPRSASRTRSQSREAEADTAASAAAELTADEADGMGDGADDAAADGMQSVTWGASTSQSELVDMFLTGRTASSRSGTRQRKEWEGPDVGTPDEVSQSLEDIMLQRFPELEPLLLQSSFTNKEAPWRHPGGKSGHTSHAPSRGGSLGASREASFVHHRPESRAGQHSPSHLHPAAQEPILPEQFSSASHNEAMPAPAVDSSSSSTTRLAASVSEPSGVGSTDSPQHAQRAQQGHVGAAEAEGQDDRGMSVVRAAALAASSPGAVVKVPTSAALSQADQIALRYQYQVQAQLQQNMGTPATPPKLGRSPSKSPDRRSPTKHRPFHLSDSSWKSQAPDPASTGQSLEAPSPRKGRSPTRSPVRLAKGDKASVTSMDAAATGTQSKGITTGQRFDDGSNSKPEQPGNNEAVDAGPSSVQAKATTDAMSFGSYGGISFSSFTPAVPAQQLDAATSAATAADGSAVDNGRQGLAASTRQQGAANPKQTSVSVAALTAGMHDRQPQKHSQVKRGPSRGHGGSHKGSADGDSQGRRSYLSVLESLAHGSNGSSPVGSETEAASGAMQLSDKYKAPTAAQAEGSRHSLPMQQSQQSVDSESSGSLSDASSTFGDHAVEALLPDEASDAQTHGVEPASQEQSAAALDTELDGQPDGGLAHQQEEELSPLAMALASLAATAAQKQQQQQTMQQQQPHGDDSPAMQAGAEEDEQASVSAESSSEDILGHAAAAAAAAGLSRQWEAPPPVQQSPQPEADAMIRQPSQGLPEPAAASVSAFAATDMPASKAWSAEDGIQTQHAQRAHQEEGQQQRGGSGEWSGVAGSEPSWSGASGEAAHGIGRFHDNQAINYVGKSARRPKAAAPAGKVGRLQGLLTKLKRGGSREVEQPDSSRPASIAGPRPIDSETQPLPATKSGSWMPKAFSRPASETSSQSATPLRGAQPRTRFADDPPLAAASPQPDLAEESGSSPGLQGALPSREAPPETFTALPSLPAPAPITADPVLASVSNAGGKASEAAAMEGSTRHSGLIIVHQNTQGASHSSTGSGSDDDDVSEMSAEP